MTIIRGLAAAVILACAVVGFAGPARANQVMQGVYTATIDGQAASDWTIYPSCVPTVGDLRVELRLPVACRLHVTPSGRPGTDAVEIGGLWSFQYNTANGRKCPDGGTAPQQEIYSFDGTALVGTLKVINPAGCGERASMRRIPFTLAFKEPLPIPVQQYPLYCEPGGLRRCF